MSGSTYHPNGKAQWVLEALEEGPLRRRDLTLKADLAGVKKATYVIGALLADGFVTHTHSLDELTATGRTALAALRNGQDVFSPGKAQPTARVFEQRAA